MEGPGAATRVWDGGRRMDEMTPLRACLGQSTAFVLRMKTSQLHRQRSQPMALPWGQTLFSFGSLPSSPDHTLVSLPQGWPEVPGEAWFRAALLLLCSNGASTLLPYCLPQPNLFGISPASPSKVFLWLWEEPGSRLLILVTIQSPHLLFPSCLPFHGERKIIKFSSLLSSSGMRTMCKALGLNAMYVGPDQTEA